MEVVSVSDLEHELWAVIIPGSGGQADFSEEAEYVHANCRTYVHPLVEAEQRQTADHPACRRTLRVW